MEAHAISPCRRTATVKASTGFCCCYAADQISAGVSSSRPRYLMSPTTPTIVLGPFRGSRESKPAELSGGQQQRTALARALVKDRRPRAARRAAGQPRLQAARGAARRAAAALRRPRRHRGLRHHRADRRRSCSAATPRRCTRAASPSSARRSASTASPVDLTTRAGLLRPADQRGAGRSSAAARSSLRCRVAGRRRRRRGRLARRRLHRSALRPHHRAPAPRRAGRCRSSGVCADHARSAARRA